MQKKQTRATDSRRIKPNSTSIPNYLFDFVMPKVGTAEFKIICAIARKTFGWWKEFDKISRSQFEEMTGLSSATIKRAIKNLENDGWIEREPGTSRTLPEYAILDRFQNEVGSNLAPHQGQNDPPPQGQNDPPQNKRNTIQNKEEFTDTPTGVLSPPKSDLRQQGFGESEYQPSTGPSEYRKTCDAFTAAQELATGQGISGAAWGKEGTALKALLKAHSHEEIRAQLIRLTELRFSDKIFWQSVSLTPSSLRSRWDAINAEKTAGKKNGCAICGGTGIETAKTYQDKTEGWTWKGGNLYERKCKCQSQK